MSNDLYLSAIVFERKNRPRLFLGSIDTLFIDCDFTADLSKRLNGPHEFALFASHTHNAPPLAKSVPRLGGVDVQWYQSVIETCSRSINESVEYLEVPLARFTSAETPLTINRRRWAVSIDYSKLLNERKFSFGRRICLAPNPNGARDPFLKTIFFYNDQGRVTAIVWSLSAHAAFFPFFHSVSADFPGHVRSYYKGRYGEEVSVLYLPGLAGSSVPNFRYSWFPSWKLKSMITSVLPFKSSIGRVTSGEYKRYLSKLYDQLAALEERKTDSAALSDEPEFRSNEVKLFQDDNLGPIPVKILSIKFGSGLEIVGLSGEPLTEWLALFESWFPDRRSTIFSGYSSGRPMYIPNQAEQRKGGYEVNGFLPYFSLEGSFVDDLDGRLRSVLTELLRGKE